ncbi:plasmid mobilization protein [Brucella anthropi]|uniref:Ribbon-helix-helix protein, CopG family n=1 Tax=Brucella anthropi TaxID=529 RepID=A0A8I0N7G9_BRUAN|nr:MULTISPECIES: hypothetical protein [Brucella/Ochrobactrum group]MBE0562953.1 hypothetical protein [Brucella anthropi]MDG9791780.1 hypothetical protein [Brucella anthropi]MDH0581698.1 hypothetical protein [Brucella anthropi]MDH0818709.1 hypothetical protein [Brucella anthropi]MDH2084962.1 hypothetical protein [Brucella anthropi]
MRADIAMPNIIRVRVLPDEKQAMKEIARKSGTTLSNLIRTSVLSDREGENRKAR